MTKQILSADSASHLSRALSQLDLSVPARPAPRPKAAIERFCIVKLLRSVPQELFEYPLKVWQREGPDFLLEEPRRKTGVEVVKAVPENQAHADVLRALGAGPEDYFMQPAFPDDARKSKSELLREIEMDASSDGWVGDSVEQQWIGAMLYFSRKKCAKSKSATYCWFDRNWLLIYDDWPAPLLDVPKAGKLLRHDLEKTEIMSQFNSIFIITDKVVIEISDNDMGPKFHTV